MNPKPLSESDPRARPKPFTFYPPKTNSLVIKIVKLGIKRTIRKKVQVHDVEISDDDLDKLRQLKGKRCLLTPSHSGGFEPHIIMYLSKLLDDEYNFVAAIELFEQSPIYRWLMPRLGVYSIIRGAVDRPSFSMTRQLLADGKRWLVIFPEGQTIWQNSMVIPFQEGVIQLAFKGFEDALKNDENADLYCIPMAIKYVYVNDMHEEIDVSLEQLETKLGIAGDASSLSRLARLRRIAEAVLVANEKVHQVKPNPDSDLNARVAQIKEHVIARLEEQLGVTPSSRHSLLDRIRTLFNKVDRIVEDEPEGSEYEQELVFERQELVRKLYEDLWRLLQFVAIHDGYVSKSMTFERFLDMLCLLEMEVLKRRTIWGPRKALVRVGEPINLKDQTGPYKEDRREAIKTVTLTLENSVRQMLDDLESGCKLVEDESAAADR